MALLQQIRPDSFADDAKNDLMHSYSSEKVCAYQYIRT